MNHESRVVNSNSANQIKILNQKKKKSVMIIEDSITKHKNRWEIAKKLKPESKVLVRTFPGTRCMPDYIKPSI